MRKLLEVLAHFDAAASAGFAPPAPTEGPGQRPQATAATVFRHGQFSGDNADPLLFGHPDLVYWLRPRGPAATFAA